MSFSMDNLNPAQRAAVEYGDGPLLVFAGAGSGKTRALTHRIANLITNRNQDPKSIMAVTFTNKAAKEMKERISHLSGAGTLGQMWVGTFHSICARILRESGSKMGLNSNFVIYDDDDQIYVVRECLEQLGLDERENNPRQIISKISNAKEQLVPPRDYTKVFTTSYDRVTATVYPLYQDKLQANNALDFDDLIMYTVLLFERCSEIKEHYQSRFKHVLVDEYQDINTSQFQFVKMVADKYRNICCVGDDDQSIYSWRGADVGIILSFQKHYPDAKIIKLEQNYRSTRNIIDAAYYIISKNERRAPKQLWTDRDGGALITRIEAIDEHDEAVRVVNHIRDRMLMSNSKYSDCVILYRMNSQSRVFEEALINHRIPYRIIGGVRFYERKEIKDLMGYLRVAFNPSDNVSLKRIINVPARGVGPITLEKIEIFAALNNISMFDAIQRVDEIDIQLKAKNAIKELARLLKSINEKANEEPVSRLIDMILESTGYLDELKKQGTRDADSRVENILELISVIHEFERTSEDISLRAFLEQVALVSDIDSFNEDEPSVTLMTIHAAKGLEFPVVYMVGMEEGVFPHNRSLGSREEIEEERRLCYVGMTRAKDELYLSYATSRTIFGSKERQTVSRFVREIPNELFNQTRKQAAIIANMNAAKKQAAKTSMPKNQITGRPTVNCTLSVGDRVTHNVFGKGTVQSIKPVSGDVEVTVSFDQVGGKKLMYSFANLSKEE